MCIYLVSIHGIQLLSSSEKGSANKSIGLPPLANTYFAQHVHSLLSCFTTHHLCHSTVRCRLHFFISPFPISHFPFPVPTFRVTLKLEAENSWVWGSGIKCMPVFMEQYSLGMCSSCSGVGTVAAVAALAATLFNFRP